MKSYEGGKKMRGVIIYSSKTGNTERLAGHLYEAFRERHDLVLCDIDSYRKYRGETFDFALIGGWIHRAMPDKKVLKFLERYTFPKIGLFVTMAAPPEGKHGQEVQRNLAKLLEGRNSLGYVAIPGPVDPKVMDVISRKGWRGKLIPEKARLTMVAIGMTAREATPEEYEAAVNAFSL